VQVVVQEREHEPEVARDRRLPGEEELDSLLHGGVGAVDVVVEGDHLVGELDVLRAHGLDGRAQRAQHELALRLQRRLERVELLLERDSHLSRSAR
jgi:hypothetical protein